MKTTGLVGAAFLLALLTLSIWRAPHRNARAEQQAAAPLSIEQARKVAEDAMRETEVYRDFGSGHAELRQDLGESFFWWRRNKTAATYRELYFFALFMPNQWTFTATGSVNAADSRTANNYVAVDRAGRTYRLCNFPERYSDYARVVNDHPIVDLSDKDKAETYALDAFSLLECTSVSDKVWVRDWLEATEHAELALDDGCLVRTRTRADEWRRTVRKRNPHLQLDFVTRRETDHYITQLFTVTAGGRYPDILLVALNRWSVPVMSDGRIGPAHSEQLFAKTYSHWDPFDESPGHCRQSKSPASR